LQHFDIDCWYLDCTERKWPLALALLHQNSLPCCVTTELLKFLMKNRLSQRRINRFLLARGTVCIDCSFPVSRERNDVGELREPRGTSVEVL
jgi:hypothetical protein